jgi:hypothetical protein
MRKHLLVLFAAFFSLICFTYAQSTKVITGKLLDAQSKEPLIGATVVIKGTTKATSVALDGSFKINVPTDGATTLIFSYIGYVSKEVVASGNLGTITMDPTSSSMKEVVVTGDIAIDRKTPVAVTTINAQTIEEKIGSEDLTATFRDVPGVMATNTSGFGDARVSIRGFKSTSRNGNVAMTINGIPVNDMENGTTYWSDFVGLSDVTTSTQIQRGLGASKIIVPSFGGTINITTRNTDAVKGGYVSEGVGSDNYNKFAALISTGLNNNGWAATFSGSRTTGNYYADNLQYSGYNFFFNLSKVISPSQTLSFSVMGASQTHNTRYYAPISVLRDAPQGVRYNVDAGVLNGSPYDPYQNYFTKPLASLNHSWIINDKSSLSTVLYGTYGTGGGVGFAGTAPPRIGGAPAGSNLLPNGLYDYTPYDLTAVEKANSASVDGSVTNYVRNSVNNHDWVGLRSTFNTQLKDINLSVGIDLKDYEGSHYQQINNLLGGQYVLNTGYATNPAQHAYTGDKVGFYNVDDIISGGAYAQAEYSKNNLSAFITLSGTDSRYQRNDYFTYKDGDPLQHSPWVNFLTYQAKGGANYNINDQMNVFANVGYITKPPYFDAVFINFTDLVNNNTVTEKLFSSELGFGFKASGFSANVNVYRSLYMDRAFTQTVTVNSQPYYINISGVNEMHQGGELEMKFKPIREVTLKGSLSVGDWYYTKDAGPVTAFDQNHNPIGSAKNEIFIKNMKIGDAPQTQAFLGVDVDVLPELRIGGDYYYTGNYTADYNFYLVNQAGLTPYKVPNYSLFNLNAVFRFKFAGLDASLIGNVANVLDTKYFSDALDGGSPSSATGAAPTGNPANVTAYYGYGRHFSTTLKIKF